MKKFGKLLLVYYHPIIFDLAESFSRLFDVEIAVNQNLKDNYGGAEEVCRKAEVLGFRTHFLQTATALLRQKKYNLVGCDGVFDGDKLIMDLCDQLKIPYFNINGYPHNRDERAKNILSFSYFLPQFQYRNKFPWEQHVKELDCANFANGIKNDKNILVFYPEMKKAKDFAWSNRNSLFVKDKERLRFGGCSLIHRYEECNKSSYSAFAKVNSELKKFNESYEVPNVSGAPPEQIYDLLYSSNFLLHLKHGDCPGIAILEAMILGAVPVVSSGFIMASQNQEVLIDNHSAFVCDSLDEIINTCSDNFRELKNPEIRVSMFEHVNMLTSYKRQEKKLEKFFEECLNG